MEKKPTYFNYGGETVIILPGNTLTKNELISRLNEMKFLSIDSSYNKDTLNTIYEVAINVDKNRILIFNKLRNDTKYYISKNNMQRKELLNGNPNITKNYPQTKYKSTGESVSNRTNDDNDNDSVMSSMSSSGSSSFCIKVLKFLYKHKIDILEKCIYIFLVFGFDAFLKSFAQKHFILGKLLNYFRSVVTPKRMILGFLVYYIIKYILNVFLYYIFGFGALTFIILIFKDKLKDFFLNI